MSHGSLAVDERRQAEVAFASESDCVIVAASTLELGIDFPATDRTAVVSHRDPARRPELAGRRHRLGEEDALRRPRRVITAA